ncbi:MAG: 50S ribosomal protein L18 [Acidobacteriota bacterium]|jgi:large subunit ribosomal protein L18
MITPMDRSKERRRVHKRIRAKISGNSSRPRLCVYRSLNNMYAQVIDDSQGKTLATASTVEKEIRNDLKRTGNIEASKLLGKKIAERAKAKGIEMVVFDRGGYLYHGRIKAVAEAARESGLKF